MSFTQEGNRLTWQGGQERVWIEAWGADALRVRANLVGQPLELPGALLEPAASAAQIEIAGEMASIRNGSLRAEIASNGRLAFFNADSGKLLCEEPGFRPGQPFA